MACSTVWLYKYEPMNFQVRLGVPLLAKLVLGTGMLLELGLVFGLRRFARSKLDFTRRLGAAN